MKRFLLVCLLFVFLLGGRNVFALTAQEILDEVEARRTQFTTQKTVGKIILIDASGKEETREMVMYLKDEGDDKTSVIFRFLSPADVKGVTLLSLRNGEKIYLYMPAYKKVRLIAGSSKSEKFMGTDFSYDDLSAGYGKEDYESALQGEDEANYYLELTPKKSDSKYGRLIMVVDKEKFYFKKIEFFDASGNLWKVLEVHEIREKEDGSIQILKLSLKDVKENHATIMEASSIEEDIPLPEDFFSVRTIQRPTL
ncbi:MAG: outer membrane lipoprotein-sorting protein [Atribacterota bacterium]